MRRSASEILRDLELRIARLEKQSSFKYSQSREINTIKKIMRANAKKVYDYRVMSAEDPNDLPGVSLDKYEYGVDMDMAFLNSFEYGWQAQYMGFEEQFLDSPERYNGRFQGLRFHPNKPSKSKWVYTDSRGNDKDVSFAKAKSIAESWLHKTWHGQF